MHPTLHPAEQGAAAHLPPCPQGLAGPSPWLQEQLLASQGDVALAARCARDLSLPEDQLPASVATELRRLRLQDR